MTDRDMHSSINYWQPQWALTGLTPLLHKGFTHFLRSLRETSTDLECLKYRAAESQGEEVGAGPHCTAPRARMREGDIAREDSAPPVRARSQITIADTHHEDDEMEGGMRRSAVGRLG